MEEKDLDELDKELNVFNKYGEFLERVSNQRKKFFQEDFNFGYLNDNFMKNKITLNRKITNPSNTTKRV